MHGLGALLDLDFKGIRRDSVLAINIVMMMLFLVIMTFVGRFDYLGDWHFEILTGLLVSYMPGWGFLFAMLIVDEMDSGANQALAVSPLQPTMVMFTRVIMVTVFCISYGLAMVYATGMLELPFYQWLIFLLTVGMAAPIGTLLVPALSKSKVEALGVFKTYNLYMILGIISMFVPRDAWYAYLLYLSPTTWAIRGLREFADGSFSTGLPWLAGGATFFAALFVLAIYLQRRRMYRLAS